MVGYTLQTYAVFFYEVGTTAPVLIPTLPILNAGWPQAPTATPEIESVHTNLIGLVTTHMRAFEQSSLWSVRRRRLKGTRGFQRMILGGGIPLPIPQAKSGM